MRSRTMNIAVPFQIEELRFLLRSQKSLVGKRDRNALLTSLDRMPHPSKAMGLFSLDPSLVAAVRGFFLTI